MSRKTLVLGGVFVLFLVASVSRADMVSGVTYSVPSGTFMGDGDYYDDLSATKLTDGVVGVISGTNAYGVEACNETDDPTLSVHPDYAGRNVYVGWGGTTTMSTTFDLHAQRDLNFIGINYLGGQYNVRNVTATFSTNGVDFSGSVFSDAFSQSAPDGGCAPHYMALDVSGSAASSDARYVKLDFNPISFGYVSEIGFDAAATPEPSVLVLMASGLLGLLAYAWRKRR